MSSRSFRARFPEPGAAEAWTGLHGSLAALAIGRAARRTDAPALLLARNGHQARVLHHDLGLLAPPDVPVLLFPDLEVLPYDPFSPHADIVAERLATLSRLAELERGVVVVAVDTALERLPPRSHVLGRSLAFRPGQKVSMDALRTRLQAAGYASSEQVWQPGQFAIRGAVVDLFPPGAAEPIRVELFDDEVESIRSFDAESQRTTGTLDRFDMLPAREYPSDASDFDAFRRAFRYRFAVDTRNVPLYQELRAGHHPQGLEQYLPLFFEHTESLFDYLARPPVLVRQAGVEEAAERFERQVHERWEQRRHDIERPLLEPPERWYPASELAARAKPLARVELGGADAGPEPVDFDGAPPPDLALHERGQEPGARLADFLAEFPGRVLFAADTAGRREVLEDALRAFDVHPKRFDTFEAFHAEGAPVGLAVLPVDEGFVSGEDLALVTESQLFGGRARQPRDRRAAERDPEAIIRNLSDLALDAPVVHEDHGVGRYRGLETLAIDDRPAEFLAIEYADGDRLYVPVSALHLVSRYTGGSEDTAPLHRLGGDRWKKIRNRAAARVRDVAAELLDLYARRQAREGHAFSLDRRLYEEFSGGFPFEETPDQQRAIDAVLGDLVGEAPMDRLVCGDVGFGKTEVALRAAFVAVQDGRQVAVLVPTTLLAQQHHRTFQDRFADWPVRIELLSRFRAGKQADAVLADVRDGKVDIVIGTHRLLQRDVKFDRLGLVIVDEEQRFGVRHKERLRQLRAEVDLLTLTATPIPRTLNMAMSGIRDLSIIATPPARRMSVR
ncbi:MAG: CarD family transcriptional regulator, partial [Xanthomonadales bacterium]|nr:CarD family transcriptional regulator [Xanthomonadales bacterium]